MIQKETYQKVTALIFVLICGEGSHATCGQWTSDLDNDRKELAAKLLEHYGAAMPEGVATPTEASELTQKPLFQNSFQRIDRSRQFLSTFNSVGVLTKSELQNQMPAAYGTAILISPCHVITAGHVAAIVDKENTGVHFSVGQSRCENTGSGEQFSKKSNGKVLLRGRLRPIQQDDPTKEHLEEDDFAIVETRNFTSVKPTPLSKFGIPINRPVLLTGYPIGETRRGNGGFQNLYGTIVLPVSKDFNGVNRLNNVYDQQGRRKVDSDVNQDGLSGGGIFTLERNKDGVPETRLAGLYIGDGVMVQTQKLIKKIENANPSLWASIENANRLGYCPKN